MTVDQLRNIICQKLNIIVPDQDIERLTKEQLEFIVHDINSPCYLEACPGSGKTEVVGIKTAFELMNWKEKFSGIAVVSFTNNASNEIEKRANKYAGSNASSHPHFIGTLDSFFYKYLLCPFFHGLVGYNGKNGDCSPRMIVDEVSDAEFLNIQKYQAKTWYATSILRKGPIDAPYVSVPISANRFYFDEDKNDFFILPPFMKSNEYLSLTEFLNRKEQQANLEQLFFRGLTKIKIIDDLWFTKIAFWKDGFLTFRDGELLILRIIMDNPKIRKSFIKRFPFIIIDECQDLAPIQLKILDYLVKDGLKVFLIGDLNQSIYKFREVEPKKISKFISDNKLVNLYLSNNFRSNQKIVDVLCEVFPNSIVGNEIQLLKNCLFLIEYDENEIPRLINRYLEIIVDANEETKREIIEVSRSSIIIRGSALLNKFHPCKSDSNNALTILSISLQLWNSEKRNSEVKSSAISFFGHFLSKTFYKKEGSIRNQYCPESISKAKWRVSLANLLAIMSEKLYPFEDEKGRELKYSGWAVFVRKYLTTLISQLPVESYVNVADLKVKAEKGLGSICVNENVLLYKSGSSIRTTTIHNIKGETLDSVMIVSSLNKNSKGGHWKDWFNQTPNTENDYEHKRFGYVALSRPKHLLVIATPKLDNGDRRYFEELGFHIENLRT